MSRGRVTALLAALLSCSAGPLLAQGDGAGTGTRFGVSFGGISTVGVVIEFFDDQRSLEIGLGTWSFRDLSVSTVVKQYFLDASAQPFVGAGLWAVVAAPGDERTGLALVLRAPLGVDWAMTGDHALGAVLNLNRALAVRRSDPEDDMPLNRRIVPLPELYYRFTR